MKTNFFKSKTFIGIICIVLAFIITFLLTPVLSKISESKIKVVAVTTNVKKGDVISDENITLVSVRASSVPKEAIKNKADVVGKISACDMFKGDYIFKEKLHDENYRDDFEKECLESGKIKVSIPTNQMYQSVSYKIQKGDIVTAIVYNKDDKDSKILPELMYMYVSNATGNDGYDSDSENFNGKVSTITLILTKEQAKLLISKVEQNIVYFALIYHGDDDVAREYIKTQDDFLQGKF